MTDTTPNSELRELVDNWRNSIERQWNPVVSPGLSLAARELEELIEDE